MNGLILLLALGLVLAVALLVALTVFMLARPPRRTYASALARNRPGDPGELRGVYQVDGAMPVGEWPRPFDAWSFKHQGATIPLWRVAGDEPNGPVAIMTHGWGDSRIGALSRVPYFARHCRACVMWDMPGQGDATGRCTLGVREAEFLRALIGEVTRVDGEVDLMLVGWSMGAGVSLIAANDPALLPRIKRIVIEAPYRLAYTPAASVLRLRGLPSNWVLRAALGILGTWYGIGARWRGFDRAEHAAKVACPMLVLHGDHDEICPLEDAQEIAKAGRATLAVIPNASHNGMWTDPASLAHAVMALDAFMGVNGRHGGDGGNSSPPYHRPYASQPQSNG